MWSTLPFCLNESLRGHHHLFDPLLVQRSFVEPLEVGPEVLAGARGLLDALRAAEDLGEQQRRIRSAPEPTQRLFVRLYFDYLAAWAGRQGVASH